MLQPRPCEAYILLYTSKLPLIWEPNSELQIGVEEIKIFIINS